MFLKSLFGIATQKSPVREAEVAHAFSKKQQQDQWPHLKVDTSALTNMVLYYPILFSPMESMPVSKNVTLDLEVF